MTDSYTSAALDQVVSRIDSGWSLRRAWPITGGVSAQVTGIEVARPGRAPLKLIVRQHGAVDRAHNPHIARDEYRLLQIARSHGLAAPEPLYVDETGDLFEHPVIVIEFVEGETDFDPADRHGFLSQMAGELDRIHRVPASPDLSFLPAVGKGFGERPEVLDNAMSEGRIRDALEAAWPLPQMSRSVLLHGDFWPGNILWRDGQLAAVIDWEDARTGDPLSDLGNARLELLFALDEAAMREFTDLYLSMTAIDATHLPYWDLCAALRPCSTLATWGLDAATEQRMRERHAQFVAGALEML